LKFIFDNPSGSGGLLSVPGPMTRQRGSGLDLDHERQPENRVGANATQAAIFIKNYLKVESATVRFVHQLRILRYSVP
jgi:hypothetical protein